ncbi:MULTISPECIES: hypothetical protein [unclassified Curtobacterium]|uniref:hypothetical protein n=1 Tax=unclassified Curtobacterium TaxID=257496 RepID=UPI003A80C5B6
MSEHKWVPAEHPDVTLHKPVGVDVKDAGALVSIDPPRPVYADIDYETIPETLHLPCFAIATSEVAVLVETSWQGRRQEVLVGRTRVFHRTIRQRPR